MKRLVILALLLTPCAFRTAEDLAASARGSTTIRPRHVRLVSDPARLAEAPVVEVKGFPMATPERATADAWRAANEALARPLARHGISESWRAPVDLVRQMVREGDLVHEDRGYGDLYTRTLVIELSDMNLDRLVQAHERELAGRRLLKLGGLLGFVLACLATLVGYIRADEATRGYYTRSLRAASLVAVGASGAALYYWLA
jgi:hypothetical protein